MKIPEEIKKRVSVDEIDLQILVKEIKERKIEIRKNDNISNNNKLEKALNEIEALKLPKESRTEENYNKMIINLNNKNDFNMISINNELPKFNKTYSKRLYYNIKIYYIILFLNIFFPGIGTIIVAIGWGNTCKYKDRTKELLLRGILQILTIIFLVGWVQAIFDAINYFEYSLF